MYLLVIMGLLLPPRLETALTDLKRFPASFSFRWPHCLHRLVRWFLQAGDRLCCSSVDGVPALLLCAAAAAAAASYCGGCFAKRLLQTVTGLMATWAARRRAAATAHSSSLLPGASSWCSRWAKHDSPFVPNCSLHTRCVGGCASRAIKLSQRCAKCVVSTTLMWCCALPV